MLNVIKFIIIIIIIIYLLKKTTYSNRKASEQDRQAQGALTSALNCTSTVEQIGYN